MTTHPATLPRPVNHHHTLAMAIVGAALSVGIVVTFAAVKVWSDDSPNNATIRSAGPVVSPETAYDLELATMAAANANRFDPVVEPPDSVPVSPERTYPASRVGVRGPLDSDTSDLDAATVARFGSREPSYPASREGVRGLLDSDTSDFDVASAAQFSSREANYPASREGVRGQLDSDTSDLDAATVALFGSREPNYPASREGVRGVVDSDTSDFDVAKVEVGGTLPDTMAAEEWNRIRDSLGLGSDLVP